MNRISTLVFTALLALAATASAQNIATTRNAALDVEPAAPTMKRADNSDIKRKRAYPMQPPTIPHKIDGYQVDLNANKCMACHSRRQTQDSQAPMVSVTHYLDREGNFLADLSPRRYFCEQCHVVQENAPVLLDNQFVDIDELLRADREQGE